MGISRRKALGVGLGVTAAAALSVPVANLITPDEVVEAVGETPVAKGWAYQSPAGSVKYTQQQAVEHAQTFDLIVPNKNVYGANVSAMRAANAELKLYGYTNGAYAQKTEGTKFPESWYLRDSGGNKIRSRGYGNFLMDVTNDGWIQDVTARVRYMIDTNGYDGGFLDMMGPASVTPGYGTGLPINKATGRVYTRTEWLNATANLTSRVGSLVGTHPVWTNGIGAGNSYFNKNAPTSLLFNGSGGSLAEYWLRGANEPITKFPSETQWKQNVDMLLDASTKGKVVLITVKTWVAGTIQQKELWHKFSLATFLLGADGTHQYQFIPTAAKEDMTKPDPLLAGLTIGTPTGTYTKAASGVYTRQFTNGSVTVDVLKHTADIKASA